MEDVEFVGQRQYVDGQKGGILLQLVLHHESGTMALMDVHEAVVIINQCLIFFQVELTCTNNGSGNKDHSNKQCLVHRGHPVFNGTFEPISSEGTKFLLAVL